MHESLEDIYSVFIFVDRESRGSGDFSDKIMANHPGRRFLQKTSLRLSFEHRRSGVVPSYPDTIDNHRVCNMVHHPGTSPRIKQIINDGKIFSYDFDRDTATGLMHHFRSDPIEEDTISSCVLILVSALLFFAIYTFVIFHSPKVERIPSLCIYCSLHKYENYVDVRSIFLLLNRLFSLIF